MAHRLALALVSLGLVALGGCGGPPASTSAPATGPAPATSAPAPAPTGATAEAGAAPRATDKVVISVPGPSLSYLPAKVADEKGFFRDEGLDIEWTTLGGDLSISAILSGNVDYTTIPSSASAAAAQGAPVRTVLFMSVKLQHTLVARPDLASVQDLAGKRIGVQRQGDLTAFESKRVMDLFHVPDVNIVTVGGDTQRLAALESGAVDAIVASAPWDLKAEQDGMHVLLAIGSVLEIPQAGLATSLEKINRDGDEIAALVRGIIRGTRYVQDPAHHDEVAALIADWVGLSQEEAASALDRVRDTYSPAALPTNTQMQLYLEMLRATGAASDTTTVDQITDFGIARRVAAEQGVAP